MHLLVSVWYRQVCIVQKYVHDTFTMKCEADSWARTSVPHLNHFMIPELPHIVYGTYGLSSTADD